MHASVRVWNVCSVSKALSHFNPPFCLLWLCVVVVEHGSYCMHFGWTPVLCSTDIQMPAEPAGCFPRKAVAIEAF